MATMSQLSSPGMIIRQKEPVNLESPFDQLDTFLTPTDLFYIRSHFAAPKIDVAAYRLRVDGAVENPLSLTCDQLRAMPSETRVATLETCRQRACVSCARRLGRSVGVGGRRQCRMDRRAAARALGACGPC